MQKHRTLTQKRIQGFASDQQLGAKIYKDHHPVKLMSYAAPDRIPFKTALQAAYVPIDVGHHFGPVWSTHWVQVDIDIPADWKDQEVHLLWDSDLLKPVYGILKVNRCRD